MPQVTTVEPDGPAIRDRRESLGLTQDALGKAAGCSRAYVCALENGKQTDGVSKMVIGRIARVLEADLREFIKTSEKKTAA
jgi:transcriptional regulator with XRE-family HTH domain